MKHKLLATFAMAMATTAMQAQTVAFPGAEGFGAWATGGRDSRKVVHVTNLNADGPGSLAEALNGSDRIVVFDVGGIIKLNPSQMVAIDKHNNITVLGQTAPDRASPSMATECSYATVRTSSSGISVCEDPSTWLKTQRHSPWTMPKT